MAPRRTDPSGATIAMAAYHSARCRHPSGHPARDPRLPRPSCPCCSPASATPTRAPTRAPSHSPPCRSWRSPSAGGIVLRVDKVGPARVPGQPAGAGRPARRQRRPSHLPDRRRGRRLAGRPLPQRRGCVRRRAPRAGPAPAQPPVDRRAPRRPARDGGRPPRRSPATTRWPSTSWTASSPTGRRPELRRARGQPLTGVGSADAGPGAGTRAWTRRHPPDVPPIASGAVGTTPHPTLPPWDGKERLNVLLVGSDQRPGDTSFNTDTMIVVSIDPGTGQVAMFQVPRDTVDVPVPANARGVWGSVYGGKINSWFTQNRNRTDLWPGKTAQARGFAALKAILGELYGLDIRYYVMVNFDGFTRRRRHPRRGPGQRADPRRRGQVSRTNGGHTRADLHPGRAAAHDRHPGAHLRPVPARQQRLRPRAAPAARGPGLPAGADERPAIIANLPSLVDALKTSVKTDIKTSDLAKLLRAGGER